MKFIPYYSSSEGNLYVVEHGGKRLVIDPGVRWKELRKALDSRLDNIVGCLVSHEHKDHSVSASHLHDRGITVYACQDTLNALGLAGCVMAETVRQFEGFDVGPFHVFPFPVEHDVPNIGFIISHGKESIFYAIDCANIEHEFAVNYTEIAIGCSYDYQTLTQRVKDGTLNEALGRRLLKAHMAITSVAKYITEKCFLDRLETVTLLHMSADNIVKDRTCQQLREAIREKCHCHAVVTSAPRRPRS